MSQSTKIDVNYLSCSNNIWQFNAGSDHATPASIEDVNSETKDPSGYASILKICDNTIIALSNLDVQQGQECAVDINNNALASLSGSFGAPQNGVGNQIFSVKGGSSAVISGVLRGSGNRMGADVLVDTWSDQNYSGSRVDLEYAKHETGRKIKVVRRFFASRVSGDVETLWMASIGNTAYWWAKRLVRACLRIPVGTKGPSWM